MKSILLTFYCALFLCGSAWAQAPNIIWQKTFGGTADDYAYCIKAVTGGYILAGYTNSNDGDVSGNYGSCDYWIVKTNTDGDILWKKTLGGTGCEAAKSIAETTDGGYVVVGWSTSADGDVGNNYGGADLWAVKLNSAGVIQWERSIGGAGQDYAESVVATADGGYILAGYVQDLSTGGFTDGLVTKFTPNGNVEWFKILGGSSSDKLSSIQTTDDGGYIVAGRSASNDGDVSGNHGNFDVWVVKLNSTGNVQWQKSFGGSQDDSASDIQTTIEGGYIVAGYTESNNGDVTYNQGNADYWIIKISASGSLQWQRTMGGSSFDSAASIKQTDDDLGFVISGITLSNNGNVTGHHGNYDNWLVKIDVQGTFMWQKCLGGSGDDAGLSIESFALGRMVVAGYTLSNNGDVSGNHGATDFWVVKLGQAPANDSPCNPISIPANGTVQAGYTNIAATAYTSENLFAPPNNGDCINSWCEAPVNSITNSVWFTFVAPPSGAVEISTCNMADFDTQIAVVTTTSCSNFSAFTLLAANDDGPGCSGYSSKMNVGALIPGQSYLLLVDGYQGETGNFDIVITPIAASAAHNVLAGSPRLSAYPNPTTGRLTISLEDNNTIESYLLSDLSGRAVKNVQLSQSTSTTEADLSTLHKGIYFLKVRSGNKVFTEKIVIQ
ncbi:MAG: T9SS type A sorting domain-containing protein [Lewinellaceae bacterium]|nr:T9SS type A sorting domain-containing protein [Lewinellaceae bacterium]